MIYYIFVGLGKNKYKDRGSGTPIYQYVRLIFPGWKFIDLQIKMKIKMQSNLFFFFHPPGCLNWREKFFYEKKLTEWLRLILPSVLKIYFDTIITKKKKKKINKRLQINFWNMVCSWKGAEFDTAIYLSFYSESEY